MGTDNCEFLHKDLCYQILGAVYNTRNAFGPGQKELVYQNTLEEELKFKSIPLKREFQINLRSPRTNKVVGFYRVDFLIDEKVILEVKAERMLPATTYQQVFHYLRSSPYEVGYVVNFSAPRLYIKRLIYTNDRKPYLCQSVSLSV